MPHNETAGGISVAYRTQLLGGVTTAVGAAASGLTTIDLDQDRKAVARALADWEQQAALTTSAAQMQASQLASDYLQAYLGASGTDDPAAGLEHVSLTRHVGKVEAHGISDGKTVPVLALLAEASTGLLWYLGKGRGRMPSIAYGQNLASRAVTTAVTFSAGATLTDLMTASPDVTGWHRLCSSRTCKRCAERATHVYPADARMWRHPGDRCQQEPVVRGEAPLVRSAPTVVRS